MRKLLLIGAGVVGVTFCARHCARMCRERDVRSSLAARTSALPAPR